MRSYPPRAISCPFLLMSRSLNLKLVEPRFATRTFITELKMKNEFTTPNVNFSFFIFNFSLKRSRRASRAISRKQVLMRARDDVGCDEFTDASCRLGAGID